MNHSEQRRALSLCNKNSFRHRRETLDLLSENGRRQASLKRTIKASRFVWRAETICDQAQKRLLISSSRICELQLSASADLSLLRQSFTWSRKPSSIKSRRKRYWQRYVLQSPLFYCSPAAWVSDITAGRLAIARIFFLLISVRGKSFNSLGVINDVTHSASRGLFFFSLR